MYGQGPYSLVCCCVNRAFMFVNCLVVLLTLGFPSYYYKFITKHRDIFSQSMTWLVTLFILFSNVINKVCSSTPVLVLFLIQYHIINFTVSLQKKTVTTNYVVSKIYEWSCKRIRSQPSWFSLTGSCLPYMGWMIIWWHCFILPWL